MSVRSGLVSGLRRGLRFGLADRVARDGPGNWYVPSTAAEFTALGLNVPDFLWLCQDASGNLTATFGGITLNASGSPLYRQTLTGWTRKFVGSAGATNQGFTNTNSAFNIAANESVAAVVIGSTELVAGTVNVSNAFMRWQKNANPQFGIAHGTGALPLGVLHVVDSNAAGDNSVFTANSVTSQRQNFHDLATAHLYGIYRNSATHRTGIETDIESFSNVTHDENAYAAAQYSLGASSTLTTARWCWAAGYKGTNAEFDVAGYLARLRGE